MISARLSDKLHVCSIIATIFVVYRHSFVEQAFLLTDCHVSWGMSYTTKLISTLTEIAVPLFFLMSGFFFFQKDYYAVGEYRKMLAKKFRNLFVPFIFWNLIGMVTLMLSGKYVSSNCIVVFLENFFLSYNYGPLWYVRDLMIYMLLSPLYLWVFHRNFKIVWIVIIPLLYYLWLPVDNRLMTVEGFLFFLLGGLLDSFPKVLSQKSSKYISSALVVIWMATAMSLNLWEHENFHKVCILLGIVAFWLVLDELSNGVRSFLIRLSKYAFFVYVTHFYFVKTLKVLIAHSFEKNEFVAWCTFVFLPIIVSLILIYIARLFSVKFKHLYSIVTGNR